MRIACAIGCYRRVLVGDVQAIGNVFAVILHSEFVGNGVPAQHRNGHRPPQPIRSVVSLPYSSLARRHLAATGTLAGARHR